MISLYFTFGIGFYVGLCLKEPHGFTSARPADIFRGLILGILFWPIGLIIQTVWAIDSLKAPERGER